MQPIFATSQSQSLSGEHLGTMPTTGRQASKENNVNDHEAVATSTYCCPSTAEYTFRGTPCDISAA